MTESMAAGHSTLGQIQESGSGHRFQRWQHAELGEKPTAQALESKIFPASKLSLPQAGKENGKEGRREGQFLAIGAAVIKYHKLGRLGNNRNLFLRVQEVKADLAS